ncbi:hypothetical protein V8E36_009861 [Tilletia maclaganii]
MVEVITDILFETRRILAGKVPDHPDTPKRKKKKKTIEQEVRAQAQDLTQGTWHNALLGRDVPWPFELFQQSPIEVLHTVWLGPVKYLAIATPPLLDVNLLRTHLEDVQTDGLDCGTQLPAKYLLDHIASLNGKEFKLLTQALPAALAVMIQEGTAPKRLFDAWVAMARLCRVLSQPQIARFGLERCLEEVEHALQGMYYAMAYVTPLAIPARPKFHLLAHLSENIRAFGPCLNFNTERFEAFNTPLREASIHSNRQSPSRDILSRLQHQEVLRHVLAGGEWRGA